MIFLETPKDFSPSFETVGCFIIYKGKFLLLKRLQNKSQGNKWGLPGGKLESGELEYQALTREISEETSIEVVSSKLNFQKTLYVRYPDYDFIYHIFSLELDSEPKIVINPQEHTDFCWVDMEEALEMDLVEDQAECTRIFFMN